MSSSRFSMQYVDFRGTSNGFAALPCGLQFWSGFEVQVADTHLKKTVSASHLTDFKKQSLLCHQSGLLEPTSSLETCCFYSAVRQLCQGAASGWLSATLVANADLLLFTS